MSDSDPSAPLDDDAELIAEEVALPDAPPGDLVPAPIDLPVGSAPVPDVTTTLVSVPPADTGYTPDGIPTFDYARERIENRYGAAVGATELAADTPEGRSVEEQYGARQRAAAEKLAQIRASMHDDSDHA